MMPYSGNAEPEYANDAKGLPRLFDRVHRAVITKHASSIIEHDGPASAVAVRSRSITTSSPAKSPKSSTTTPLLGGESVVSTRQPP